jgi:GNAT superfamily N-acetyltransferase
MQPVAYHKDDFCVSTDTTRLDIEMIHAFLQTSSYWAQHIPRDIVETSIAHSLCFGLYHAQAQIGFTRLITDYTTLAYLTDVFVSEAYRGRGLGTWMLRCVLNHPDLQRLGKWVLATADAHEFYAQFGFQVMQRPERTMEWWRAPAWWHAPRQAMD